MTLEEFDALCRDLPGAEMVVQWGQSHVYKIGGKVFAIGRRGGRRVGRHLLENVGDLI